MQFAYTRSQRYAHSSLLLVTASKTASIIALPNLSPRIDFAGHGTSQAD